VLQIGLLLSLPAPAGRKQTPLRQRAGSYMSRRSLSLKLHSKDLQHICIKAGSRNTERFMSEYFPPLLPVDMISFISGSYVQMYQPNICSQ